MLVSSVGFVLFRYGKKMRRAPHAIVGIVSLVYPYAVGDVTLMLVIAAVLWGGLWLATRYTRI